MIVRALFWIGYGWRGKAFAIVCGIIGLCAVASAAVPYTPYTSIALEVIPNDTCPVSDVKLKSTRVWRETWYQNIESAHVSGQWQNVRTGALYPAIDAPTSPKLSQPTGTVIADYRIPAPRTPGEYVLLLQYDVTGGVLLAPRHQDVPDDPNDWLHSVNTLTVKACEV